MDGFSDRPGEEITSRTESGTCVSPAGLVSCAAAVVRWSGVGALRPTFQ
nr:hypothetical protein [Natrinema limicola]